MGTTNRDGPLVSVGRGQQINVDGFYANLDWDVGSFKLSSISGYREQEERLPNTYTGAAPVTDDGQIISLFDAERDTDRNTLQQELRIASTLDGPVNYVLGAFYQRDNTKFCVAQLLGFVDFTIDSAGIFGDPHFFNNNPQILCNRQEAESYAGYGDVNFAINDRLTIGGGLRWTKEKKTWHGRNQRFVFALGPNTTIADLSEPLDAIDFERWSDGVVEDHGSWSEPTYRGLVQYKLTDDWNTYVRYDRGFRSGGYNDQVGTSGNEIVANEKRAINPEFANAIEIGSKLEALDSRVRFNAAAFYVKYKDAQRALNSTVTNPQGCGVPADAVLQRGDGDREGHRAGSADATGRGADAGLRTTPGRTRSTTSSRRTPTSTRPRPAPLATRATIRTSAVCRSRVRRRTRAPCSPPIRGRSPTRTPWSSRAASAYESKNVYYYSAAGPQFDAFLDSKTLYDLALTYRGADRWFVKAYGRNLSDERYRVASQAVATLWTHTQFGEPRSYGLAVGMNFGTR